MKSRKYMNELKSEWKEMSIFIASSGAKNEETDQLQEELKWLKKQLDYYSDKEDQEMLTYYFNEVVDKVNDSLHLSKDKKFKKKKST